MSDEADLAACAALLQRGDPERFRSVLAAPLAVRPRLLPLYAFNLEVARAPWVTQEPLIAEMRLQWWRDALGEIASGGPVRRHEVVTPLAAALDAEAARALDGLIEARRADIEGAAPEGRAALLTYLDATAGTLLRVAARLSGAAREDGLAEAGRAQGVAAFLRAAPDLIAKGRHALPHGDPEEEMRALAEAGTAALDAARRAPVDPAARPALAVLAEVPIVLDAVRRDAAAALDAAPEPARWRVAARRAWIAATGRF